VHEQHDWYGQEPSPSHSDKSVLQTRPRPTERPPDVAPISKLEDRIKAGHQEEQDNTLEKESGLIERCRSQQVNTDGGVKHEPEEESRTEEKADILVAPIRLLLVNAEMMLATAFQKALRSPALSGLGRACKLETRLQEALAFSLKPKANQPKNSLRRRSAVVPATRGQLGIHEALS